ncbi:hypothetical protein [Mucilaginibacter rubeus]|uniref:Uncharacterized protein n=1 Tax=Mucilaginibacter rubeus TaxID=2027860 RepID=A0A5C1HVR5_9SPHI|nr:hypothetical protein [Mucilaginibacter rubeus]QEM09180.1 hypothetical protein DEO27_003825 [Mucilaginibacter rubeus]
MVWIRRLVKPSLPRRVWVGLVCFLLWAFSFQLCKAQTFAEWFSQKKTQIKYLTQQIAALNQYGSYVRQGYQIAKGGWNGIGNWVLAEFNGHSAYYSSLRRVNPAIRDNPKADSTLLYAEGIPLVFDRLDGLSALGQGDQEYIAKVKAAVLEETDKDVAELDLVMTDGKVEMRDDKRIRRLDLIYERVRDKLGFSISFGNAVRVLIVQRRNSINDINTLKSIYGKDEQGER